MNLNSTPDSFTPTYEANATTPRQEYLFLPLDVYRAYSFALNVVCTPIVCLFGLFFNSLGIIILYHDLKFNKQNIFRYMLSLMISDNIFLIVGLVLGTGSLLGSFSFDLSNVMLMHVSFGTAFLDTTIYHSSSALLVLMALERLNALARPLKFKQSFLANYPWTIIISIAIFSFLIGLPLPISFRLTRGTSVLFRGNQTFYNIELKEELLEFYQHYSLIETIVSVIYPVCMIFLNIAIIIAFYRVRQKRRSVLSSGSQQYDSQQIKITVTVILIAIMYTLLSAPKLFIQFLFYVDKEYNFDGIYKQLFYALSFLGDVLMRINAANDFFIYVLVSDRYRKIVRRMVMNCVFCSNKFTTMTDLFRNTTGSDSKSDEKSEKSGAQFSTSVATISGADRLE